MTDPTVARRSMRILIVAHAFPPMNSTASHRPYSWARVWRDLGHEVHVLTAVKHGFDGTVDMARDLCRIYKYAGADDAAHDEHRRIKRPEAPGQNGGRRGSSGHAAFTTSLMAYRPAGLPRRNRAAASAPRAKIARLSAR